MDLEDDREPLLREELDAIPVYPVGSQHSQLSPPLTGCSDA